MSSVKHWSRVFRRLRENQYLGLQYYSAYCRGLQVGVFYAKEVEDDKGGLPPFCVTQTHLLFNAAIFDPNDETTAQTWVSHAATAWTYIFNGEIAPVMSDVLEHYKQVAMELFMCK